MNSKDLLTITAVALGTAALTVATFWGNRLEAEGDANAQAPTITKPEMVAGGIKLTLASAADRSYKAGEVPGFTLTAINTRDQADEAKVRLTLTATAPSSPFSRMLPVPAMLWQQECTFTLAPSETKTLTLTANTNLPANSVISVSIQDLAQTQPAPAEGAATASLMKFSPLAHGMVLLSFSTEVKDAVIVTAAAALPPQAAKP